MDTLLNKDDKIIVFTTEQILQKSLTLFNLGLIRRNGIKSLHDNGRYNEFSKELKMNSFINVVKATLREKHASTKSESATLERLSERIVPSSSKSIREVKVHPIL